MPGSRLQLAFASALSEAPDPADAVAEVIAGLHNQLADDIDLLLFFASTDHRSALSSITGLLEDALKPRVMLGALARGVIGQDREIEQGPALSAIAATLPGVHLHPFALDAARSGRLTRYRRALRNMVAGDTPPGDERVLLMLVDPFSTPLVKLLPAIDEAVRPAPIFGALVNAGKEAGDNRIVAGPTTLTQGAAGVMLAGPLAVHNIVSPGCRPIGRPLVITRAKRHVVQQLAGRNALSLVRELAGELDDHDRQLVEDTGLLVGRVIDEHKPRFGRGDFLIRSLVGVDPDAGYIAIGDPQIRVGQTIQFHLRDQEAAATDLAMLLDAQRLHGPAAGALMFSDATRGSHLYDEPDADAAMIQQALGHVPLAGCFAAGEIGSVNQRSYVHGHTANLLTFRAPDPQPATV
ncbi:MAG: FIST N-terminal domain-containing protein [Phycisphaeraceae bacterium]